ncbi:MAG: glycosyltransferase family 39 protein [Cyanobacteria bacterium P01_G01_bin.39]
MTIQNKLKSSPWFQIVLPLIFFIGGLSIINWYGCFEFDPDEGINLIKAFLLNSDYQLYQDIWNDQPPLLTYLLSWWFKLFEANVDLARILILLCSTILLWQTWLILYLLGGVLHAYIGCLFLLIAPNYWKLSVSVMVGLPCITLALGALLSIILWHKTYKRRWLIVSALLLSLSVLTKLFTFFIAPIILGGIICDHLKQLKKTSWYHKLQLPALWLIIFSGSSLLILILLVGIDNIDLLVNNHTSARTIEAFQDMALGRSIKNDYRLFLIGFTIWGSIIACKRQQWQILYFAAWSSIAYWLLINHRPIWYHQVLLLQVPAIIMVGYALGNIITTAVHSGRTYFRFNFRIILTFFTTVVFYCAILLIGEQTKTTSKEINYLSKACNSDIISTSHDQQFLTAIEQSSQHSDWLVTDSPIFAFRAGMPVPPQTAVLSRKQLETGNITEEQLIEIIKQYQPHQILFKRFEWSSVVDFLQQDYRLQRQQDNFRLYVKAEAANNNN